jgi:hypothetical protein
MVVQKESKKLSLRPEDVIWVVNDLGELGVCIKGTSYFMYKGESLVYRGGKHEDGSSMMMRPVKKREFGEVCRPPHFQREKPEERYTEGDGWIPLT